MANQYVSGRLQLSDSPLESEFSKAELQLLGLQHAGASYQARVFINNPDANEETPPTSENGYAGQFSVFGHGGCFGDAGHCDVVDRGPFDPRPPHPLRPLTKAVSITGALKNVLASLNDEFTISIVAIPIEYSPPDDGRDYLPEFDIDRDNVLEFEEMRIVTYD
ncbi:MAG: hypothetical protein OXC18_06220 [Desulfurellaceae bacterium]|nr:hypothetical protein [Desulfurellaceae bacterium]